MDMVTAIQVGAVVVITAGFRETGGEGAALEGRMLAVARRHGMRLVGPNCMGVQNAELGVRPQVGRRGRAGRGDEAREGEREGAAEGFAHQNPTTARKVSESSGRVVDVPAGLLPKGFFR